MTYEQCEQWLSQHWKKARLDRADSKLTLPYAKTSSRAFYIARWLARDLADREPALLWVTSTEVGLSNWQMYYRFRQSYGDVRQLHEAPGHVCLDYEADDMASLLQITMLNGWDASFVPSVGSASLTFSHHGFIDVFSDDAAIIEDLRKNAVEVPPPAG